MQISSQSFDVIFLADLRFPGGTSTALASEMRAALKAGLRVAVKPVRSTLLRQARPVHPDIMQMLASGNLTLLGPDAMADAQFLICHHPMLFTHSPVAGLGVTGTHVLLVLHHPPYDGLGRRDYDVEAVCKVIELLLGTAPVLAPVGPLVRDQLAGVQAQVLAEDWLNLIDPDHWPDLSQRDHREGPLHIGRHSRPHGPKWPDDLATALKVYPKGRDLTISMLGADPEQLRRRYTDIPAHWDLKAFAPDAVQDYLAGLDLWVYYHGSEWVEAFGRAILEAAVSGLTVILPPHFKPLFGRACIYADAAELVDIYAELAADRKRLSLQGKIARDHVIKHFGPDQFEARLTRLDPNWHHRLRAAPSATLAGPPCIQTQGARRVLYMSSNGVGLGHLTRLLAIAEADTRPERPVFFTMSRGAHLVREAGFRCEFMPFHRGLTTNNAAWNGSLAARLDAAVDFHDVGVVVFDGNMPYQGIVDVLKDRPDLVSVWCRRGFWRKSHEDALKRARHFDLILQPQDIADPLDVGPTTASTTHVAEVPPIWRVPPGPLLDREAALADLGLDPAQRYVLVSLGSQTNFSFGSLQAAILRHIAEQGRVAIWLQSPLAQKEAAPDMETLGSETCIMMDRYPIQRHFAAFDYAVSAVGYNSFHELTTSAVPTIWMPNEAGEMDQQDLRAVFAEVTGLGLRLRSRDVARAGWVFGRMAQEHQRHQMIAMCQSLTTVNGAQVAAREIGALAAMTPLRFPFRS